MKRWWARKHKTNAEASHRSLSEYRLSAKIEENIAMFKDVFFNDDTIVFRTFDNNRYGGKYCAIVIDGLVDHDLISKNIIRPILEQEVPLRGDIVQTLKDNVIPLDEIKKTEDVEMIAEGIVSGETVLIADGCTSALIINTKKWVIRAIEEPITETIARGPREGFTESLMVNLGLIRRKFKTPDLKFKFKKLGSRTKTSACLVYVEQVVNKAILGELVKRLEKFDLDGALGAGYIEESIMKDSLYSPFHTVGTTERPDTVAGKLLEGRIAIFLDGTPVVLTVPFIFPEVFQVNEDYYNNYIFSSTMRMIRIIGFIISVTFPAIYVALVSYHQEFLPTDLLLSIAAARDQVPFPSVVEVTLMVLTFEVLREAATRMPSNVGQALSIVGALVLGQAAVEAKLVSAPVIIIVGLAGITTMLIPKAAGAIIILRLALLTLAMMLGMYGVVLGIIGLMLHLYSLRSFGVPYMLNTTSARYQDSKDIAIRGPWWTMRTRPKFFTWNTRRKSS